MEDAFHTLLRLGFFSPSPNRGRLKLAVERSRGTTRPRTRKTPAKRKRAVITAPPNPMRKFTPAANLDEATREQLDYLLLHREEAGACDCPDCLLLARVRVLLLERFQDPTPRLPEFPVRPEPPDDSA